MTVNNFGVGTMSARSGCGCICTSDTNYSNGYRNGSAKPGCGGYCYTGNTANNAANYELAYVKVH